MNLKRLVSPLVVAFIVLSFLAMPSPVRADFLPSQAQDAVNSFNALNNGQGYYYKVSPDNGAWRMTTLPGTEQPNFDAYSPLISGDNFLKTLCVEPDVGTAARQYGTLSYENGATTTQNGDSLTLGAAYLFSSFVKGTLDGYDYDSPNYGNGTELGKSIQYLIGAFFETDWLSNDFLAGLLDINSDQSYWEQTYDPGMYYEEIGDYSVFVMNNRDEYGTHAQDFLYVTAHTPGKGGAVTPEPASLLVFGTGLAGLAFAGRFRKKFAAVMEK